MDKRKLWKNFIYISLFGYLVIIIILCLIENYVVNENLETKNTQDQQIDLIETAKVIEHILTNLNSAPI